MQMIDPPSVQENNTIPPKYAVITKSGDDKYGYHSEATGPFATEAEAEECIEFLKYDEWHELFQDDVAEGGFGKSFRDWVEDLEGRSEPWELTQYHVARLWRSPFADGQ